MPRKNYPMLKKICCFALGNLAMKTPEARFNVQLLSGQRNLKSLDSYKAASVEHQRRMSLILRRSGEQNTQSSTVSSLVQEISTAPVNLPKAVNPNKSFQPGVFSGTCTGKIEGCSFTFSIHRKKEESPKSAKPKRRRIIISDDSDSD